MQKLLIKLTDYTEYETNYIDTPVDIHLFIYLYLLFYGLYETILYRFQ